MVRNNITKDDNYNFMTDFANDQTILQESESDN